MLPSDSLSWLLSAFEVEFTASHSQLVEIEKTFQVVMKNVVADLVGADAVKVASQKVLLPQPPRRQTFCKIARQDRDRGSDRDVLVKRNGRWQILSRKITPFAN
jgi:hypothetical protein